MTLHAGIPAALIDLVADLAWLTGQARGIGTRGNHRVGRGTLIDEAIGVLIGHGYAPGAPLAKLDARARGWAWTASAARSAS